MKIAFFDFDGTITNKDSLGDFIKYAVGPSRYYFGLIVLSPVLLAYLFKLVPNYMAKEILFGYFFKTWTEEKFTNTAYDYSEQRIEAIFRSAALERIKWHKESGHTVCIVSASLEAWLQGWCQKNHLDLIATVPEVLNGKITGKFASKNCFGPEKLRRIHAQYTLSDFDYIYAYGDSAGDKEMLDLANESFYKPFR